MTILEYYFEDGSHVIFDKYTIDTTGVIRNKKTGVVLTYIKNKSGYNAVTVYDDTGKSRGIYVGRALASTFHGHPHTLKHTADHIDRNPENDILENIRWNDESGQQTNRTRHEKCKSAFVIVKDGDEKTVKEWVEHLKDILNPFGREYTESMIGDYARKKQHGFAYKEYPDLPNEVWKEIVCSKGKTAGYWEISDMNRVRFVTKHAVNTLSDSRLGLSIDGYPRIEMGKCHILSFKTFFPEEYAAKKPGEVILHEDDNKMDFRPHKLRIGTKQDNGKDAHNNELFIGKKTERKKCASFINNIFEKEYLSQTDAMIYLKSIGINKASDSNIHQALDAYKEGKIITRYGRTWKKI